MRISDIRCHIVPAYDAAGLHRRNWVFVEVETDAGIIGLGEATTEYHEAAVIAQIEGELRPRLLGMDPTDIERIWQLGYREFWWRRGVVQSSAMSGIDQALWDIAGKAAGLPVFKLLGGRVRDRVRCYTRADFGTRTAEDLVAQVLAAGFTAYKHSAGAPLKPFDLRRQVDVVVSELEEMRRLFGANVDLMVDLHGWFDLPTTSEIIERLQPLDMLFIEEPMNQDALAQFVRAKQSYPKSRLAAGERLITRWDCQPWFVSNAIDVCQVDISHCGGLSEIMRIAAYAELHGIAMAPHNPYGPVAFAASVHAAAAMPNFLILEHCRLQPLFDAVQIDPIPIINGMVELDAMAVRPGLGVTLDKDQLRGHAGRHAPMSRGAAPTADGGRQRL